MKIDPLPPLKIVSTELPKSDRAFLNSTKKLSKRDFYKAVIRHVIETKH